MATESVSPAPPPPPPPTPSKGRSKYIWPLLLVLNVSLGAHLYMRTKKEEKTEGDTPATDVTSSPTSTANSTAAVNHVPTSPPAIVEPVKPIPVDQQIELFKWILEEKRKVKTKDPQEKKKIDEEKALLKQFIRSKSVPSL